MSLVESCPSTLTRSNERLTVTPSRRSHVSGDSAASVCTKHSSVAKSGEIIPAPLAWALSRTVPASSATSRLACLSSASVVRIARAKSVSPSGRSACVAATMPCMTAPMGSGTPITPVDATAIALSSPTPLASAAAPCILAAFSNPGRPVAALALPALTTMPRIPSSVQRSRQSSTGADWVPERVKRAALVVAGAPDMSSPRSRSPLGLIPQATPAARKPRGSPPAVSVMLSGTSIQREEKNERVAVTARPPGTANPPWWVLSPRPRANRT